VFLTAGGAELYDRTVGNAHPGTVVEVCLYLAELFSGITAVGERVFDASVEGVVPLEFTGIDAVALGGAPAWSAESGYQGNRYPG
jgi:hypothetical protein